MVVKNIRYGETCGIGCGPVSGPTFSEVMAYDKNGRSVFVCASILDCSLIINISDYPLFDILRSASDSYGVDFEFEMEKAKKLFKADDEYDVSKDEEKGYGHYYPGLEKVVDLALLVLKENGDEEVVERYLDENLDDMDVPLGPYYERIDIV